MIEIELIRHAKTPGNAQKKYIGATDESLSENGKAQLAEFVRRGVYSSADIVFTSPMKRCRETAAIIFGAAPLHVVSGLAECDFGDFEGKTYSELADNAQYREWIASGGRAPVPNGEPQGHFSERSRKGFEMAVKEIIAGGFSRAAIILHGGSIMSLMEKYALPPKDFYAWQVQNCGGYKIYIDKTTWDKSRRISEAQKIILPDF